MAVVKHLQAFPQDGVALALEDFLGFEGGTPKTRKPIVDVFRAHGLPIEIAQPRTSLAHQSYHDSVKLASPVIISPAKTLELGVSSTHGLQSSIKKAKTSPWETEHCLTNSYNVASARLSIFRFRLIQIITIRLTILANTLVLCF